jgi:hypothetical protein
VGVPERIIEAHIWDLFKSYMLHFSHVRSIQYVIYFLGYIFISFQIFKRATKAMSSSKYATLSQSVPVYNWIFNKLEDLKDKYNSFPDINSAIECGCLKLQEYYSKTQSSVYAVSLSM